MKRLFLCLLLVFAFNVFAEVDDAGVDHWTPTSFGTTAPLAAGVYVDRFTDTAISVTSTSVSLVHWPSGAVIWTASTAPFHVNRVNWQQNFPAWTDGDGVYHPAWSMSGHYFEFTTPPNSPIHAHFPNADSRGIALKFEPKTRNGRQWIDLYYDRLLLDPLGGGYCTVLYKSYVKQ